MAILRSGILGQLRGKVAGVVGAQWKDKNYIREYVQPANPNTVLQQTQRAKMADTVAFCKSLVGPIFNAYTDRFQKSMSGFNRFIKTNIGEFDGTPDYSLVKLAEGKLSSPTAATSTYTPGTGTLVLNWVVSYGNNGAADDECFAAVYDKNTGLWYFASAEVERSVTTIEMTLATGLDETNLESWLITARYSNTLVELIANSLWQDIEAP